MRQLPPTASELKTVECRKWLTAFNLIFSLNMKFFNLNFEQKIIFHVFFQNKVISSVNCLLLFFVFKIFLNLFINFFLHKILFAVRFKTFLIVIQIVIKSWKLTNIIRLNWLKMMLISARIKCKFENTLKDINRPEKETYVYFNTRKYSRIIEWLKKVLCEISI